jgi:hypothetical protein
MYILRTECFTSPYPYPAEAPKMCESSTIRDPNF